MNKPFCPILLIGFPAPEEGKRDLRRCTKECAWYDSDNDCCQITTLSDLLSSISSTTGEITTAIYDQAYPIGLDESYDFDPNTEP